MSIRMVAFVGVAALTCGVGEASPRNKVRKRTGPFAEFIDPTAPVDPPVPWRSDSTWLSVVFLIDRAVTDGPALETLKTAARQLHEALEDDDQAAILAFDNSVEKVLRGAAVVDERQLVTKVLAGVTARGQSDLPAALAGARAYLARAPYRKVIIVFTDPRTTDERLPNVIAAARKAHIELMLVVPGQYAEQQLRFRPELPVYALDRSEARWALADRIFRLHDWE